MDPVVHFEFPAEDRKRIAAFYQRAFGWKPQFLGEEMGGYVVVTTTALGKNGRPINPGAINGGFYQQPEGSKQHPSVVIAVEDIEDSMRNVELAGGRVISKPENIPGIGLFVSISDTEGNFVRLLQPMMAVKSKKRIKKA
jgi:predicted enzyme related to lactoylglutathione lyase